MHTRLELHAVLLIIALAISSGMASAEGMTSSMGGGGDGYISGTPMPQGSASATSCWDAHDDRDKRMQNCRRCQNCATEACRTQCWRKYCRE
jgi:hypothetical protein